MEEIVCHACQGVSPFAAAQYEEPNAYFPAVLEVGVRCMHCGHSSPAYYLSPSLVRMRQALGQRRGNLRKYQLRLKRYQSAIKRRIRERRESLHEQRSIKENNAVPAR